MKEKEIFKPIVETTAEGFNIGPAQTQRINSQADTLGGGEEETEEANLENMQRNNSLYDTFHHTQEVSNTYKRFEVVKKTTYFQKNKKAIYE